MKLVQRWIMSRKSGTAGDENTSIPTKCQGEAQGQYYASGRTSIFATSGKISVEKFLKLNGLC
ncbi:hypothetical protein [Pseudomonas sp. KCJK8993]|uniref:hypothetical protein n=1 Tax=Pseudomonas sp. KCJK8993 TaxID=3344565 RepID=UPI003905B302